MGPNLSGQAVCAFLRPQEAMQMVPKFCFPFDVERYVRKQTSRDRGTQRLKDSDTQGPRELGTLTTGDLYTQDARMVVEQQY